MDRIQHMLKKGEEYSSHGYEVLATSFY